MADLKPCLACQAQARINPWFSFSDLKGLKPEVECQGKYFCWIVSENRFRGVFRDLDA